MKKIANKKFLDNCSMFKIPEITKREKIIQISGSISGLIFEENDTLSIELLQIARGKIELLLSIKENKCQKKNN